MRLFLSYSRSDAAFVDRLRADLERAAHEVWLDRDAIRGGEQWRASIAEGLTSCERVVLVVSPRSMASEAVAREVSMADDLDRDVVPVVLEPSSLPPSMQYLLVGVQQVSFDGRAYDEAFAQLRAALGGARPQPLPPPRVVIPPSRKPQRRWVGAAVVLGLLAVGAIVAKARVRTPGARVAGTSVQAAQAGATTTAAVTTKLSGHAWLAGVRFAPQTATYAPDRRAVDVTYQVEVTQSEVFRMGDVALSMRFASGAQVKGFVFDEVPGRSKAVVTVEYDGIPDGFVFGGAVLVFGASGDQQWTVPMSATAVGTGTEPIQKAVSGSVTAGDLTFSPTRVELVPWSCRGAEDTGGSGRTLFTGIGATKLSVLLTGSLSASDRVFGGDVFSPSRLVQPNGNAASTVSLPGGYEPGASTPDYPLCFPVDAPGAGEYRLEWKIVSGDQQTLTFTIP